MHVLKDLFTTDLALMSVVGIAFMLGVDVFSLRYFLRHTQEDAEKLTHTAWSSASNGRLLVDLAQLAVQRAFADAELSCQVGAAAAVSLDLCPQGCSFHASQRNVGC